MIDMHLKYDNMHKNEIFYALICINNDIITCINCMLLMISTLDSKEEVSPPLMNQPPKSQTYNFLNHLFLSCFLALS